MPKDHFSTQAETYAKFRPTYPDVLFELLYKAVAHKERVWDCGTGNGQVAVQLAKEFAQVEATDISQKQLDQAKQKSNIHYQLTSAEKTSFKADTFDLITVAQALHWFKFDAFYKEVHRVLKPEGVFAAWTYRLLSVNPEIDALILAFYQDKIGPYWPAERKHIDQRYESIPFPFQEISEHQLESTFQWTVDHLIGYLNSWSSTQRFIQAHDQNPVDQLETELRKRWGTGLRTVTFPILLKIAKRPSR